VSGIVVVTMDPHERATSCWYRVAGLLRRNEIAIEIIECEIRSAQQEIFLEASRLVLTGEPIEIARKLRARAEQTIRRTSAG
jgi:hypothetical protein